MSVNDETILLPRDGFYRLIRPLYFFIKTKWSRVDGYESFLRLQSESKNSGYIINDKYHKSGILSPAQASTAEEPVHRFYPVRDMQLFINMVYMFPHCFSAEI